MDAQILAETQSPMPLNFPAPSVLVIAGSSQDRKVMIRFPFFSARPDPVAALYGDIVAMSRAPQAYRDFGVADDFEGRFERLALVSTLVLRRLRVLGGAADDVGQRLVDRLFADLDEGLRLAGSSDISVGKKVKKLAQGFYGRAEAYTRALEADETALRAALSRNLFGGHLAPEAVAPGLIAEIRTLTRALDEAGLDALLAGAVLAGADLAGADLAGDTNHPHTLPASPLQA
jgi:cytochrome b pre-mRNA-processing protein 3